MDSERANKNTLFAPENGFNCGGGTPIKELRETWQLNVIHPQIYCRSLAGSVWAENIYIADRSVQIANSV